MIKFFFLFLFISPLLTQNIWAQEDIIDDGEDDLTNESDIFSDFNEDLEASQVLEDERYYRYGRFFQANVGFGATTFTGVRGQAYDDNHPTIHFAVAYFMNFQSAITLGIEYSKHTMFIDTLVNTSTTKNLGAVETTFFRPFIGFRYYLDTSDLGTALTYSNPYFIGRFEYWYQQNNFREDPTRSKQKGGGVGSGIGFGFEFPVELKVAYIGVEFMYHRVNFFDKYTNDYAQIPAPLTGSADSKYGYDNLAGDVLSLIISYNFTW